MYTGLTLGYRPGTIYLSRVYVPVINLGCVLLHLHRALSATVELLVSPVNAAGNAFGRVCLSVCLCVCLSCSCSNVCSPWPIIIKCFAWSVDLAFPYRRDLDCADKSSQETVRIQGNLDLERNSKNQL